MFQSETCFFVATAQYRAAKADSIQIIAGNIPTTRHIIPAIAIKKLAMAIPKMVQL